MLSQQVYSKDNEIKFVNFVLALCHEIKHLRRVDWVRNQIIVPRMSLFYRKIKVYRLARIIHESTRLIANNYEAFGTGAMEDRLIRYRHPRLAQCLILALGFKYSFPNDFSLLEC